MVKLLRGANVEIMVGKPMLKPKEMSRTSVGYK